MTKMTYRGHTHNPQHTKEAAQSRSVLRPELVYRGVTHNGVVATQLSARTEAPVPMLYRGFAVA